MKMHMLHVFLTNIIFIDTEHIVWYENNSLDNNLKSFKNKLVKILTIKWILLSFQTRKVAKKVAMHSMHKKNVSDHPVVIIASEIEKRYWNEVEFK